MAMYLASKAKKNFYDIITKKKYITYQINKFDKIFKN